MERCSPEEMKETVEATATPTALVGSGPWPPSSSLEMVLLWRLISPSRRLPGGGNFVVPFDLGFLSLYRLSDSRHPDYVFGISGLQVDFKLRLGRILCLDPSEKNYLQLCSFKFFRLRPSSSVSEAIFKTCLVGTDFRRVKIQLLQDSFW